MGLAPLPTTDFAAISGRGVRGVIDHKVVLLGNRTLMEENGIDVKEWISTVEELETEGKTVMMLDVERHLLGLVAVIDRPKASSRAAISDLKRMHIQTVMVTGDNRSTAEAIAQQMGIDEVIANVLPQDKENKIRELQAQKKVVAMVGDEINDAPALAAADLGIARGSGTDVAIEAAGITLMNSDLRSVVTAIQLSRATMRNIKQNLGWAFGYNVALIPVAAGILFPFFGILLNPILAGAAMALSSLSVVSNSLRLRTFRS